MARNNQFQVPGLPLAKSLEGKSSWKPLDHCGYGLEGLLYSRAACETPRVGSKGSSIGGKVLVSSMWLSFFFSPPRETWDSNMRAS